MATNSKWTAEEDSVLVEAVLAGTPFIGFMSEKCSTQEYQLDREFVGIQSPNIFQEGVTSPVASGGFIR